MVFRTDAIDHNFDCGVELFHNQQHRKGAKQQDFLDSSLPQPESQRRHYQERIDFQPERFLVPESSLQARHGIPCCSEQAREF